LNAVSNGGYIGKCLTVSLKNNTAVVVKVKVDPALIFVPDEPQYQHLVAVGEEEVLLRPQEQRNVSLQTFCGKASARGPAPNVRYKYWKQGDSTLVLASHYIKEHGLFNDLGQHAVWMFTDKHKLSNVYNPHSKVDGRPFVTYLARITRQKVPQFHTWHKINDGRNSASVYEKKVSKIYVDITWNKESRRNMHVQIYNENNELYRTIETGQVSNSKGEHHVRVALDPAVDPEGFYTVRLKDDENNIWLEKEAIVEK
jgi:hypothetical protein